ncbi:uncharacterized protein LOC106653779 isoform X1 [Trichogramma pretiosum]|uniref:uncharacterized protein LOC106653779 isoform X1 n=2 Tax=Trichogramma pretiosum TaxID=7493 RepID=UPI0006C9AF5A|nr:uncharacterized protein LOC106653779 isoform X1 [Trichogramma pretiosum]
MFQYILAIAGKYMQKFCHACVSNTMPSECIANPLQRELADSIIRLQSLDELRILLACGAKPNEPVTQGLRPLHYAVWQRYEDAAQLLLVRGAEIDATDECGYSALHLAAEHGYLDLVKLLLKHGAKVDHRQDTGELFPRTLLCDEPLRLALRNHHLDVARTLLEHGANSNKRYFFGSEINLISPLDLDCMALVLAFGADPNSRDRAGLTPLMKAVRLPQKVLAFEKWYRNVFTLAGGPGDLFSGAAAAAAAGQEDAEVVVSSTQASSSSSSSSQTNNNVGLHRRRGEGRVSELGMQSVLLLLNYGADVNARADARNEFRSVLHYAVIGGDKAVINLLLKQGARLNLEPEYTKPRALDMAVLKGDPEIVKLLLDAGADVNTNSAIIGTPLHVACAESIPNRYEVLELLLERGADPNRVVASEAGGTLLRPALAEYVGANAQPDLRVIGLLLRHGARVLIKSHFREPLGMLQHMQGLERAPRVLAALLDAAESVDLAAVARTQCLTELQKRACRDAAGGGRPLSLVKQARLALRRLHGGQLAAWASRQTMPKTLRSYLLYEYAPN